MGSIRRLSTLTILVALMVAASPQARAQSGFGSTKLAWDVTPLITLTLTPNYQSGFGPTGGSGSGSTPAAGSGASLGGGYIDFGNQVVQGYDYIYHDAVEAAIVTNDGRGFTLYGEGTNISDTTAGGTVPINQILYWLVNNTSNNEYTPSTPFTATSSATSAGCGGQCINYGASLPPASAKIWAYSTSTAGLPSNQATQGYDYQLKLGTVSGADTFSVYITYTAVGN